MNKDDPDSLNTPESRSEKSAYPVARSKGKHAGTAGVPHPLAYESPRKPEVEPSSLTREQKFYAAFIGFIFGFAGIWIAVSELDTVFRNGFGILLFVAFALSVGGAIAIGKRKHESSMLWPTLVIWALIGAGFCALIWGTCYTTMGGPYHDGRP